MPSLLVPLPYAARIGGYEGWFGDLCAVLPGLGWEIEAIAIPSGSPPQSWTAPSYWERVSILGRPWWSPREYAAAFRREIARRRPDVVISYTYDAPLICGPNVPPGPRVVERVGNTLPYEIQRIRAWQGYFDGIMPISEAVAATVAQGLAGVPEARRPPIRIVPHGIRMPPARDVDALFRDRPLRLVWFGRLKHTIKRVLDLVPICQQLDARGVDYQLDIVGEGEDEGALRERLGGQIAAGRARVHAAVPNEAVYETLDGKHVFLNTSDHEGGPRTLIEAMSCNLVPVVTDIGGYCQEVVRDGENGFRLGVGDSSAFADRLALLARDRDRLIRMARLARPSVDPRYRLESMGVATDAFLREVLDRPPHRRLERAAEDLRAYLPPSRVPLPTPVRLALRRAACRLGVLKPIVAYRPDDEAATCGQAPQAVHRPADPPRAGGAPTRHDRKCAR